MAKEQASGGEQGSWIEPWKWNRDRWLKVGIFGGLALVVAAAL